MSKEEQIMLEELAKEIPFDEALQKYLEATAAKVEVDAQLALYGSLIEHFLLNSDDTTITDRVHEDSGQNLATVSYDYGLYELSLSDTTRKTVQYSKVLDSIVDLKSTLEKQISDAEEAGDSDVATDLSTKLSMVEKVLDIWSEHTRYPVSSRLSLKAKAS